MSMPYGYRWIVEDDLTTYSEKALDRECMPHEGGTIIPWDCMMEFGMDHEHDTESCETLMAAITGTADYADTEHSGWYGGERGYNDGLRWSDFV